MLLKRLNAYWVGKLWAILLFEAENNQNNKQCGRDMMRNAELHNTIACEQYGSQKDHAAIDDGFNKRLSYDIIRQKKIPAAHLYSDAVSCYDRIVHTVAVLAIESPRNARRTYCKYVQHNPRT